MSLLFVLRTLIELALFMLKENKRDMHYFLQNKFLNKFSFVATVKNELQMTQELKFTWIFFMLWFSA